MKTGYDVVVIGGGIVGSAIARELSGYRLSVALLEARDPVLRSAARVTRPPFQEAREHPRERESACNVDTVL